jgi:hypothetical protein
MSETNPELKPPKRQLSYIQEQFLDRVSRHVSNVLLKENVHKSTQISDRMKQKELYVTEIQQQVVDIVDAKKLSEVMPLFDIQESDMKQFLEDKWKLDFDKTTVDHTGKRFLGSVRNVMTYALQDAREIVGSKIITTFINDARLSNEFDISRFEHILDFHKRNKAIHLAADRLRRTNYGNRSFFDIIYEKLKDDVHSAESSLIPKDKENTLESDNRIRQAEAIAAKTIGEENMLRLESTVALGTYVGALVAGGVYLEHGLTAGRQLVSLASTPEGGYAVHQAIDKALKPYPDKITLTPLYPGAPIETYESDRPTSTPKAIMTPEAPTYITYMPIVAKKMI